MTGMIDVSGEPGPELSRPHLVNVEFSHPKVTARPTGKRLTLDELESFVQAAHRAGIPGDASPTIVATWTAGIKSITIGS